MPSTNPYGGFYCPRCNQTNSHVRETRKADGLIYRRRACDHGHEYWTVEQICPAPDPELRHSWLPSVRRALAISQAEEAAHRLDSAWHAATSAEQASEEEGEAVLQERDDIALEGGQ